MARELSETLEAAQKFGLIRWPFLIAKIRRRWGGVIRYDWENLYSGDPSDPGAEKLIGSEDVSADGQLGVNQFHLTRFQAEKTGVVRGIRYRQTGTGAVKIALYADDEGEPGALLSANNTPKIGSTGWNGNFLPPYEIIEGTYYWLAFNSGTQVVNYHSATGDHRYKTATFSSFTFPNPAGTGFSTTTTLYALITGWNIAFEYNSPHCVAMPSDGSLIRLRVTESGDNRKLYYQRVTSPDEASDFSTWTFLSIYDVIAVASCAYGTNVFQCRVESDRKLYVRESADSGASWGSWSYLGYVATTAIHGFSAAYKPNGDVGMFWIDQATVYRMRRISGEWESKAAWDKTTGTLSGIAVYYYEDWNLVITGQDSLNKWTVWTIIYGDGERQAANTWSDLKIIIQRLTTEPYEYHAPSIGRPDTTRLFFVENFTQAENLNHVWYSHMPPSPHFDEEAWLEPVPMEPQETMGLAFCQYGSYAWLTNAGEVYRALATDDELDIASKLLTLDMRQYPDIRKGYVRIAVDNTAGIYSNFARLGDELTIGLGFVTASGNEYSLTSSFWITEHKLVSPSWSIWRSLYPYGVLGTLDIEAQDAWDFLKRYKTRRTLSWAADEKSITELLQYFFARSGLDFEVQSASDAATNFKPEFSVARSTSYRTIIKNLMKMIPDQLIFREAKVILRNPTTAEAVDWTYHNTFGTAILVFRGKYGTSAWDPSRVEVWTDTEMKEAAEWPQVARMRDRLARVTTPTYPDLTRAEERADAELRKAEILTGEESWIQTGVNCGLEPWDKLQITDLISGVENIYRRAIRIRTKWDKLSWNYHQVLSLGAD